MLRRTLQPNLQCMTQLVINSVNVDSQFGLMSNTCVQDTVLICSEHSDTCGIPAGTRQNALQRRITSLVNNCVSLCAALTPFVGSFGT